MRHRHVVAATVPGNGDVVGPVDVGGHEAYRNHMVYRQPARYRPEPGDDIGRLAHHADPVVARRRLCRERGREQREQNEGSRHWASRWAPTCTTAW